MAQPRTEPGPASGVAGAVRRSRAAWRGLSPEHRLCGVGALALLVTMFLPWYTTSRGVAIPRRGAQLVQDSQTAIQAFSFVEAAVLLVSLGVLALLFARGERRAFHLPGGDGTVVAAAGVWAALLIVWRLFDKPELGRGVSVGLTWGIFVALGAAAALAVAGNRLRAAHRPEPPLEPAPPPSAPGAPVPVRIPEERPHLDETRVMGERAPLSRELAARDTADFGAVPDERPTEPARRDDDADEDGEGAGRDGAQPRLPGMPE